MYCVLSFLRGEGQHLLKQLQQKQQHSRPQQQKRAIQRTIDKTMSPPMIIAATTGHLQYAFDMQASQLPKVSRAWSAMDWRATRPAKVCGDIDV